jgi:hypothetical protein
MKKAILIFSFLAATLAYTGCDKITGPYVIHSQPVDTSACPAPQFPAVTDHFKHALLEDYTGHFCPNCPRAGLIANGLKTQYGDSLIVMAVHSGYFSWVRKSPFDYNFRTEAGSVWDSLTFKIVSNPNGLVNRRGFPALQHIIAPNSWAGEISKVFDEAPLMDLQLISEYNSADDKLCIHTKTTYLAPINDRSLNLSIVITEDSIVSGQKNSDPLVGATPQINNFVHNHIMRGTVNGVWGTPLLSKGTAASGSIVKSFPLTLANFNVNTLVPRHCHVVAFVFDTDTKEVLQVAECEMIE